MTIESCDVLIIGAGPAGSVAAALVQKAGFHVRVVEKDKFPRFVIGESLLPRCMEVLDECGFIEGIARNNFQKKVGAKFMKGDRVADFYFSDQFSPGWSWTWQVPRATFDHALIEMVGQRGVRVDFETAVTSIAVLDDERSVTTVQHADGKASTIEARFIIDASGYGRVIPRLFKLDAPSNLQPRQAIFAHVEDSLRQQFDEPDRIIIINYAPGIWSWVIPFSTGVTSLGFVGDPGYFEKIAGDLPEKFASLIHNFPYLKSRFGKSNVIFEPKKLEGWSTKTEKFYGKGFVLTGNVTEFLDPIFSSGVMFATVSSQLAAHLTIKKLQNEAVDWQAEYSNVLKRGVDTFRAFVTAWYDGTLEKIFYHREQDPLLKKQICSILAGYVWDEANPFVMKPDEELKRLAKYIDFDLRMNIST